MEIVGAYEAKTHLSNLLERVIQGESITITKHGVPVAVLQPPESERKREPSKVISEIRDFQENYSLDGLSVRDMIEEGRS